MSPGRTARLVAALATSIAAVGCGKTSTPGAGGDRGVAQGTFKLTIQNGQGGNASLAIKGGYVTSSPAGIDCGVALHGACSADFTAGTAVTLTGHPDTTTTPPNKVLLWVGDCSGIDTSCTVAPGAEDRYVVVVFGTEAERTAHSNFTDPAVHRPAWDAYAAGSPGALDCRRCHGANLQGLGIAPSCAACHPWPLVEPPLPPRTLVAGPGRSIDLPVVVAADNNQRSPAVSFDGTFHVAAWVDERWASNTIYATRIDSLGNVMDPGGIDVGGYGARPAIASAGGVSLVAWSEFRYPGYYNEIRAARLTSDGQVLDYDGFVVAQSANSIAVNPPRVSVGSSPAGFYVVWEDALATGTAVRGARVTSSGTVLDPGGILISDVGATSQPSPAIAGDGTDYLVAWVTEQGGSRATVATRVSGTGERLDASPIALGACTFPDEPHVSLAFDGTRFLVVWSNLTELRGARVAPSGEVLDPGGFTITSPGRDFPSVLSAGSGFVVGWRDGYPRMMVATVSGIDGVVGARRELVTAYVDYYASPEFSIGNGSLLVLWTDLVPGGSGVDVLSAVASATGTAPAEPPTIASSSYNNQRLPAVNERGSRRLVVWTDSRGAYSVRGAFLGEEGGNPGPSFEIAPDAWDPAVACDEAGCLVVYRTWFQTNYRLFGRYVGPNGLLYPPFEVASGTTGEQSNSAIAWNGALYLVSWNEEGSRVWARRFTADLRPVDSPFLLSNPGSESNAPSVSSNGSDFMVVWLEYDTSGQAGGTHTLLGARVAGDGALSPSVRLSPPSDAEYRPAIASDGLNYFVIWPGVSALWGRSISSDGMSLGSVVQIAGSPASATLRFSAGRYLAAWAWGSFAYAREVERETGALGPVLQVGPGGYYGGVAISATESDAILMNMAFDESLGCIRLVLYSIAPSPGG